MTHKMFPDDASLFVFVAGVAGSVVASAFDFRGWKTALRKIVVGSISSIYVGPWIQAWFPAMSGDSLMGFVGFVTGLCGLLIVETIMEFVKARRAGVMGGGDEADH